MAAKKRKAAKREKAGKQPVTQDGRTANSPERRAAHERHLEIAAREQKRREHDAKLAKMFPEWPREALRILLAKIVRVSEIPEPKMADFCELDRTRCRAAELLRFAKLDETLRREIDRSLMRVGVETTNIYLAWETSEDAARAAVLSRGFDACRSLRDKLLDISAELYMDNSRCGRDDNGGAATEGRMGGQSDGAETNARKDRDGERLTPEARAMAVYTDNPGMQFTELSKRTGIHRSRLYEMPRLMAAKNIYEKAQRESRYAAKPRGEKDSETGQIEAYDEVSGE